MSIAPDAWPGFRGLYYLDGNFGYIIDNILYDGYTLAQKVVNSRDWEQVSSFNIDYNGSQILVVINSDGRFMLFQEQNGVFILLTDTVYIPFSQIQTRILKIPSPLVRDIDGTFGELPLKSIDQSILERIQEFRGNSEQMLFALNNTSLITGSQTYARRMTENIERTGQTRSLTVPEVLAVLNSIEIPNSKLLISRKDYLPVTDNQRMSKIRELVRKIDESRTSSDLFKS